MNKVKIAVLGSDGSGKSTFVKYLRNQIEKQGRTAEVFSFGWKDFQNPIVKLLSRIHLKKKEKKCMQEEKLARFRPRGWMFYIMYYFELFYRYIKVKRSKSEFIIFDRYFYDELTFAQGAKFSFFKKITPKVDLCVILKAQWNVLRIRGENITEERLNYFYEHLNRASEITNTITLNSSKSIKDMYSRTKTEINKLLPDQRKLL